MLSRVDRDALRRALKAKSPGRRQPPVGSDVGFDEATSAAYSCQMDNLHLKPWQDPPCWADDGARPLDDHRGRGAAWELRRRLIAAGLSQYEPNPVAALEAAAARQRAEAAPVEPPEKVQW